MSDTDFVRDIRKFRYAAAVAADLINSTFTEVYPGTEGDVDEAARAAIEALNVLVDVVNRAASTAAENDR